MEVTWSCNKSKLIFRLWNITEGVCLSSINLVLPGIQRTTSGTGTVFIQPFKLIYNFGNVSGWRKYLWVFTPHPNFPGISILGGTGTQPLPLQEFPYLTLSKKNVHLCSISGKRVSAAHKMILWKPVMIMCWLVHVPLKKEL